MAFCTNCGANNEDNASFCTNCGAPLQNQNASGTQQPQYQQPQYQQPQYQQPGYQQPQYQQPQYQQPQYQYPPQNPLPVVPTGGLLAWSIVTLLLCTIPGIIAIVNVAGINNCTNYEDQNRKISTAKTCCLIGTILGGIAVLLSLCWPLLLV